jgi:lipoic acid synthetase
MGKECTRNCGFCDIDFSKTPSPLQEDEPLRVALSVKKLGLQHVVVTMVARDDLDDGGSAHLVEIIKKIRECNPASTIEVLTSDFNGNPDALEAVLKEQPEIFNHNIETVRRLTPRVRHQAHYDRTLAVLQQAASQRGLLRVKSGLMAGLGEQDEEVYETLKDLKAAGCEIVTIGQYLQPSRRKLLVKEFVTPEKFKLYEEFGRSIGIPHVYSGPFIRSSYNAAEFMRNHAKL